MATERHIKGDGNGGYEARFSRRDLRLALPVAGIMSVAAVVGIETIVTDILNLVKGAEAAEVRVKALETWQVEHQKKADAQWEILQGLRGEMAAWRAAQERTERLLARAAAIIEEGEK